MGKTFCYILAANLLIASSAQNGTIKKYFNDNDKMFFKSHVEYKIDEASRWLGKQVKDLQVTMSNN